jgi:glycosyltransferase involved in cell wall biosynthesis
MKLFAIKALDRGGGGAERVLVDVVNGLAARGHEIGIVTYDAPHQQSFYQLDPRITWIRLGIGRTDQPATIRETLARMAALRRTVLSLKPEVVVGFMHSMFIPLGLSLVGTAIPVIASEHIAPAHYETRPLQKALIQLTPWITDRMTVVSDQLLAQYPRKRRDKILVIPNPVSLAVTRRANVVGAPGARKVLLSVGRLAEQKDFATLVSAFGFIVHELPDWDLRIVGEGELRPQLEAQIQDLGLMSRISLPGSIEDISSEYAAAQLFVLPSHYESLGLVVIEALAHGLPAVGFADCPGVNQLIKSGQNGILVSSTDRVAALAQGLKSLMANDEARQKLIPSITAIPAECDRDSVIARWERVFDEVGNRKRVLRLAK